MLRVASLLLMGLVMAGAARAGEIPDSELAQAPSAQRVAALQSEAAQLGWAAVAPQLRSAAVRTYERQGAQAQAWYYLYRWADLFGQTGSEAVRRWSDAVRLSRVGYGNGFAGIHPTDQPLGDLLPSDLQAYVMGSRDFSDQFFTVLSPLDHPVMVLHTLAVLWRRNPAEFRDYSNLAIAIAVVYDVPPPPVWPHRQVTPQALPRGLIQPAEVFGFFVKSDRAGALLQPLRKLPASELKYVVDTSANLDELFWAQQKFRLPLAALGKVYEAVHYRRDRAAARTMIWPLATYRLPDILQAGGICVDQAYFAAMVGKAKGVPTLIFSGAGLDGNHAWFGFLDGDGHWQLDCARYLYQGYVVGFAIDPQTWTIISDHELKFLNEGFRRLPLFKTSVVHRQFAEVYLEQGDNAAAAKAARAAVSIEPRNLEAWYRLLSAQERMGAPPREVESALQEASLVFQRYADVEADFKRRLAGSLRGRGEASAADLLERSIAKEDETARESLNVQQAYVILQRCMEKDDVDAAVKTYYSVVNSFGNGADIVFFHEVVQPFVEYLLKNERPSEAVQAVGRARKVMRVEPRAQLDVEMSALMDRAQALSR
jgi:tetratricopeptide (TPR) repeat protein